MYIDTHIYVYICMYVIVNILLCHDVSCVSLYTSGPQVDLRARVPACKRSAKSYKALPNCELDRAARRNKPQEV